MRFFFHFWTTHVRQITDAAIAFIETYAREVAYPPDTYIACAGDYWPYWNFLVEGAVMAVRYHEDGSAAVPWLVTEGTYFTGTVHAFTERRDDVFIQTLAYTRVVQLPNYRLQQAQRQYHSVSELINILKQRRLERDSLLDEVFRQTEGTARVAAFFDAYPRLAPRLTAQQVCAILKISESTYKRGKKSYYRGR